MDEKLSWSSHITMMKAKMMRYVGIMHKIKRKLPLAPRLQIYQSFVQSHLNYCSLVWGFASKSLIDSLFSKQKQGIRAIMPGFINYFYREGILPRHTKTFFDEHEILTVHGLIAVNSIILLHKIKHACHNSYLKTYAYLFPTTYRLKTLTTTRPTRGSSSMDHLTLRIVSSIKAHCSQCMQIILTSPHSPPYSQLTR